MHPGHGSIPLASADDLQKAWEDLLKKLHKGELTGEAHQKLFEVYGKRLFEGVQQGYGMNLGQLSAGPDEEMLKALRENVYVFSGFKTHQALQEARDMLFNEVGEIRSFAEFRERTLAVNQAYNVNWLLTEYNMAVGQGSMAAKWVRIEQEKDILPWLKYRSVLDSNARHKSYNGITRPVEDPVWDYLTPLLDWGCRCTLEQISDGAATPATQIPPPEVFKPEFRFNPGKDKVVFPANHPYFNVAEEVAEEAGSLFGLEIPELKKEKVTFKFKTAAAARKFILDEKLADDVKPFFSKLPVKSAGLIAKALYENRALTGKTYGLIDAKRGRVMASNKVVLRNNKPVGKPTLQVNPKIAEFDYDRITKKNWVVCANEFDVVNHEFGHLLTTFNVFRSGARRGRFSVPKSYALSEYAKTNLDEALAEIYAAWRKGDSRVSQGHIDLFNKYSIVPIIKKR